MLKLSVQIVFGALVLVGGASGEREVDAGPPPASERPMLERERLTGDWFGARSTLERAGLSIGGESIAEFSSVFDGGINERGSFRNLLTLDAELDLETAFGLDGGTVFVQYLSVNAETGGSLDAGDIQVFSNIENDRSLDVLFEVWYEQSLFADRLRFKIGKVDANSEFAFVDAASDFSNSSAGFSPTVFAFPSYPDSATSVSVFGTVFERDGLGVTVAYGLFDGAAAADGVRTGTRGPSSFFSDDLSDDYFHIWQAEVAWDELCSNGPWFRDGRVSAGVWHHSGSFDRFDGGTETGVTGVFATGEIRIYTPDAQKGSEAPGDRGVVLFGQYGWADDAVSEFAQHFGGGVVWRGPLAHRGDDSAGVYLSFADLSDSASAGFGGDELTIDTYYRMQVAPAIFVQPEAQFIFDPSGNDAIDDALVGGLRVGVTF